MITNIIAQLVCALFIISFCFYSKYQFADQRNQSAVRGKWHPWGAVMRACMIALVWLAAGWKVAMLAGSFMLPMFDIGINLIALNEHAFYVGSTDSYDRALGMWKWPLYLILIIASIVIYVTV